MDIMLTLAGVAVIVLGLRDMFHTLLHPRGQGSLSRLVLSGVWRASRAVGHRLGSAVGPAAMVAVIALWVALQGVGWALIYLPHVPKGFTYSPGVDPADYPAFTEALYVSFTTLSTAGFGDVVATEPWIRAAAPLEALTGFALLTAALTWFTQVYPPLSRRRALALALKDLHDADTAGAIEHQEPVLVAGVLDDLTGDIEQVCIDFAQHLEGYYFQEQDPELSLARQLPYALELRDSAQRSAAPQLQAHARRLSAALEALGTRLGQDFVSGDDLEEIFTAYAAEHGRSTRT